MRFFTADTHFFHEKLINDRRFSNRNFLNVWDMNETIIESWNKVVTDKDIVYHLGDISLVNSRTSEYQKILELLKRLNGRIVFIKGNHDSRALFKYLAKNNPKIDEQDKFEFTDVGLILKFSGYQFFLTHYPLIIGMSKNSVNLHGHIHNSAVNMRNNLNVGEDSPESEYLCKERAFGTPYSEDEIVRMVEEKVKDFQLRR